RRVIAEESEGLLSETQFILTPNQNALVCFESRAELKVVGEPVGRRNAGRADREVAWISIGSVVPDRKRRFSRLQRGGGQNFPQPGIARFARRLCLRRDRKEEYKKDEENEIVCTSHAS